MKKKWIVGIMVLLLPLAAGCAKRVLVQPSVDMKAFTRLAVLPFETDSYLSTVGNQLADEIVVELIQNAPSLDIVERTRIDALVSEQNLVQQGYINPETAIKVGQMLGVKGIITGSVSVSLGVIRPTPLSPRRVATGTATLRLIDVATGRVVWGVKKEAEYTSYIGTSDEGTTTFNTDHEMVQKVVHKLAESLAQSFYPHYELQY